MNNPARVMRSPFHIGHQTVKELKELKDPIMTLRFNPDKYTVHTIERDGLRLTYRAFDDIAYVEHPADDAFQRLNVYVPEAFYDGETINGYGLGTAPVFMPNTVGGYMPGPREAPGPDFMGKTNATFHALLHGYVVVSTGVRGRGMKDADGRNIGVAPADICDLKAAVRFIRHNADIFPGNAERIISNGTSAGGAMSALQGITGNHPDYGPYLKAMGAADERDDVFASSCYCPITNLDHADMAYEWEFNGLNDFHRFRMLPPTESGQPPIFEPWEGEMDEARQTISDELKTMFPQYLNSLNLHDAEGTPMTLNADGTGSFVQHIETHVLASAQRALDNGEALADDAAVTAWLTIENGKATAMDWRGFVAYRTRMKAAPAFDDTAMGTPENELFGTSNVYERHFSQYSFDHDTAGGAMAPAGLIKLMNPMNYINDAHATKAQHIRIRHGAADRDTSLAISNILELALEAAGVDVELAHPWGVPHSGDYDLPELFAWIDRICAQ